MTTPLTLVRVDASILSSYGRSGGTGGQRANLRPLAQLGHAGFATPDTASALLALNDVVLAAGGDFRVTELHRDVATQQKARIRYDRWVAAGKPAPGSPGFDSATMKPAFVAVPGRSMHNAGRAIDVDLSALRFPGVPADRQLDRLWDLARPLGWAPVIRAPDERASEAWHLDYWGELKGVLARLGYAQAAFAGALLVGHAGNGTSWASITQTLLARAGYDLGEIDGLWGERSRLALSTALDVSSNDAVSLALRSDETIWPRLLALTPG